MVAPAALSVYVNHDNISASFLAKDSSTDLPNATYVLSAQTSDGKIINGSFTRNGELFGKVSGNFDEHTNTWQITLLPETFQLTVKTGVTNSNLSEILWRGVGKGYIIDGGNGKIISNPSFSYLSIQGVNDNGVLKNGVFTGDVYVSDGLTPGEHVTGFVSGKLDPNTLVWHLEVTQAVTGEVKVLNHQLAQKVYRLYNVDTGEHFFTVSYDEFNRFTMNYNYQFHKYDWKSEGEAWYAGTTGTPVYRIHNPKGGDHYYTTSFAEAKADVQKGWKWDNSGKPVFYSKGKLPVYVAFNPHAKIGAHNYTTSLAEQKTLLSKGWKYGKIAWYAETK